MCCLAVIEQAEKITFDFVKENRLSIGKSLEDWYEWYAQIGRKLAFLSLHVLQFSFPVVVATVEVMKATIGSLVPVDLLQTYSRDSEEWR